MSYHEILDPANNRTFRVGVAEHEDGYHWGMKDEISDPHRGRSFGPYKTHREAFNAAKRHLTTPADMNKRNSPSAGLADHFAFKRSKMN